MINYDPQKIRQYWPKFRKRMFLYIILFQVFSVMLVALLSYYIADMGTDDVNFWIMLLIYWVVCSFLLGGILSALLKPQRVLLKLISQISSDSPDQQVVNINSPLNNKNGLNDIVKFIYSLDTGNTLTKDSSADSDSTQLINLINDSPVGIIVLNAENHVAYSNAIAPHIGDLIFTNQTPILEWVKTARKDKISDDTYWKRIPNSTADDDNRKIYDIYAKFKKGSSDDVIIYFVDKTATYTPEEDDLNFIAFAAHELRGPITIIRGYLDVLSYDLQGVLSPQQSELFKRLTVSANKLSGYINNILNVSRYDRNRMAFDLSEHSVQEVVDSVREDVSLRASSQNRLLEININSDLPTVGADLSSISEVLTNIIDNAIKYSNEGGLIKVCAARAGDFVDISVEDYGIGIPSSVMSNLFHKFYRSHRSRETVAGTGIGLYISKAIVEGHGGQISVKSVEGEGSTFTISLPIFSTIANKLLDANSEITKQPGGGWIKNHGKMRG